MSKPNAPRSMQSEHDTCTQAGRPRLQKSGTPGPACGITKNHLRILLVHCTAAEIGVVLLQRSPEKETTCLLGTGQRARNMLFFAW
jgi:hypothetical protein